MNVAQKRLQEVRENDRNDMIIDVSNVCEINDISVPHMDECLVPHWRSRRTKERPINRHHVQVK